MRFAFIGLYRTWLSLLSLSPLVTGLNLPPGSSRAQPESQRRLIDRPRGTPSIGSTGAAD